MPPISKDKTTCLSVHSPLLKIHTYPRTSCFARLERYDPMTYRVMDRKDVLR